MKAEPRLSDGKRISVMSRHTLNDGVTPDPEISCDLYDEWWPELSPPDLLVGAYYKRGMEWSEFETEYLDHLRRSDASVAVARLIQLAKDEIVTVLCIESDPAFCHRRLLAEECQLMEPDIEVSIR